MLEVNPEILKWAREGAGLSLDEVAKDILGDAHGKTAAERLADLESGKEKPTRQILNKMAKKYQRPVLVFYLPNPPKPSDRGEDFRNLPTRIEGLEDAKLNTLIRKVKASQALVRDLLEDEEAKPLNFISSVTTQHRPNDVAKNIVKTIDFDIKKYRAFGKISDAFEYLRDKVQDIGIFVILIQNLGSHHSNIPLEFFRGFVIADEIAPFIVINDSDAVAARTFTLLHELTHLWLGTTGISGDLNAGSNNEVEQFCNQVAAQILLASEEFDELKNIRSSTINELAEIITKFAQERNLSRSMVAYKLFLDEKISIGSWQQLSNQFQQEWRESIRRKKEKEGRGGPNYYVVKRSKLGWGLTNLADRALSSGSLTPNKASIVLLGVKLGNVHELVRDVRRKGTS